ncbi:NAD(P)/FAD-dependent oxidoreductase [Candidatus Nanopelagicales bacterium]|nr:NAD(P)/FAD-dependent oxidoreductase [Actinomycetota bacterium]MDC1474232.1 NAD(P)/FAD-dependent oxidoreductase [Candidatus Nanopelagicales bacterium]
MNTVIEADIVVAGAGHNALIAAAYLAKAGKKVAIADARSIPGGGVATEEFLPGYFMDSCSTGHTIIQGNPVIKNDSLGLIKNHGLKYVDPDPVARVAMPDGEQIGMYLDRKKTYSEFARFSDRDADRYFSMLEDWDRAKSAFSASNNTPIGWGPPLDQLLDKLPNGGTWRRRRALSAVDVIMHEFTEEHIQAFLLWEACQTFGSVDLPGSGVLPYSIMGGRQERSWTIPVGGSGKLTEALVSVITEHGGSIHCNTQVSSLLIENGRAIGFESADGTQFVGKEGVLSTIHIKHLVDMAPKEAWGEDFVYGVDTYDIGIPLLAAFLVMNEVPTFAGKNAADTAVSSGLALWPSEVVSLVRDIRDRKPVEASAWTLVATPTLVDPDRAPEGMHTVKILVPASHVAPYGATSWDEAKEQHADRMVEYIQTMIPNMNESTIQARIVKSPLDIEAANQHMINGCAHGGDKGVPFSGPMRPVPGWASHKMPIDGLYQTGGTTHPGGSITGAPGRNAAMVMMKDLDLPFSG